MGVGRPRMNINSRLKGAVDRELGGKYIEQKISIFDFHFHCYLHLKRSKMIPSPDLTGSTGSGPQTVARHLPSTRAGGQDDGS